MSFQPATVSRCFARLCGSTVIHSNSISILSSYNRFHQCTGSSTRRSLWRNFYFGDQKVAPASTRAQMASSDVLRTPDEPLQPGQVLRIYSMRMCPYAQRARLIIAAKKIPHDIVNVDLNKKPDWFFDLNPYGEVPIVLHNGGHVYESLVTAEYLDDAFPDPVLYSKDPLTKAYEKIYYNHWTKKGIPAFYSLLKTGYAEPEQTKRLQDHVEAMDNFLKKLGKPYFHGDNVGFSDYMIWPWFERMPMLGDITEFKIDPNKTPHITAWVDRMWKDHAVQACKIDAKLITEHYAQYRTGKPDFTIGADKSKIVEERLENLDAMRDPATRDRKT